MISADLRGEIRRLFHAEGWPVIAREWGVHHAVARALLADGVPLSPLKTRRSKLDPYVPFLRDTLDKPADGHPTLRDGARARLPRRA